MQQVEPTPLQTPAAPLALAGQTGACDVRASEIALERLPVALSWARIDDHKILFVNRKFVELFGYTLADLSTVPAWIKNYPFAEDRLAIHARWSEYLRNPAASPNIDPCEVRIRCKDGSTRVITQSGILIPETGQLLTTLVDVTAIHNSVAELRNAQRAALESQTVYQTLLNHSQELMVVFPVNGGRRFVSPAVTSLTGFTAAEFLALQGLDFMHPEDREPAREIIRRMHGGQLSHTCRFRLLQRDGSFRWVDATLTGYLSAATGALTGLVATLRDGSANKQREDQLAQEHLRLAQDALHDELTGLFNRRGFNSLFHHECLLQTCSTQDLSLLLFDIDCFKQYNDTYGHPAGDECLKRVAVTLRSSLRGEADILARYGGEEFIALLTGTSAGDAHRQAERALLAIAGLALPHRGCPSGIVTVSAGVGTWPAGAAFSAQQLIASADAALYQAKANGRNRVCGSTGSPNFQLSTRYTASDVLPDRLH